jgi:hypothetical protein
MMENGVGPLRFDSFTRSLVVSTSRRGLLGGLATFAAGLVGKRAAAAQVSQVTCGNKFCYDRRTQTVLDVCADGCVCCVYTNSITGTVINSRCRPPGTCSPGIALCPPGEVVDPIAGCVPEGVNCATAPAGTQCAVGKVCSGGQCVGNGVCAAAGPFGCGPESCALFNPLTGCLSDPEGGIVCVGDVSCESPANCTSSAECPTGFVCATYGCTTCAPICGAGGSTMSAASLTTSGIPEAPSFLGSPDA